MTAKLMRVLRRCLPESDSFSTTKPNPYAQFRSGPMGACLARWATEVNRLHFANQLRTTTRIILRITGARWRFFPPRKFHLPHLFGGCLAAVSLTRESEGNYLRRS